MWKLFSKRDKEALQAYEAEMRANAFEMYQRSYKRFYDENRVTYLEEIKELKEKGYKTFAYFMEVDLKSLDELFKSRSQLVEVLYIDPNVSLNTFQDSVNEFTKTWDLCNKNLNLMDAILNKDFTRTPF